MRIFLISALAAISITATHCTPAKMALAEENWLSKKEYPVEGRKSIFSKERMNFGEYYTTTAKRSWTQGTSARSGWTKGNAMDPGFENIISVEYINRRQTLRFELADDKGNQSEVFCVSKFKAEDLLIGKNPNNLLNIASEVLLNIEPSESKYYVQIHTSRGKGPWQLVFDNQSWQRRPKQAAGVVALNKEDFYSLVPVTQMQRKDGTAANMPFGAIGIEVRNKQDKPVAAVSMINKGVVYLSDVPVEERFLLANICAALLMQEQIGG
ncbi:hypothetical protein [Aridibaculum aurantiacum]|uniref:hypothetical protein n=1 Tax=Aridibaculum aurantiacum TaxID=2810307 RepID=UPI001A97829E|nr:hypothetical protein [Aridibaculum aurantiacum]